MNLSALRIAATCIALVAACHGVGAQQQPLVVVSFGGDTSKREDWSFYRPFSQETGIPLTQVNYNGGVAQIAAQVQSKNVTWGTVAAGPDQVKKLCDDGMLEDISKWNLAPAPDGTPAKSDFVKGSLIPCGAGFAAWSVAVAYSKSLPKQPTSVRDFFDLKNFPGKRALFKSPMYALEFALLADGVASDQVYNTLGTREGVDRAFRKLDTIKKDVVWWESWTQGMQLLADKEVSMGISSSSRLRVATNERKLPIGIIWSGQLVQVDYVVVPKGTRNLAAARKYVEYITRPDVATRVYVNPADWTPPEPGYPRPQSFPVRKSSISMTKLTAEDKAVVEPMFAALSGSAPKGSSETIIDEGGVFWGDNQDALTKRFIEWLQK